VAYVRDNRAGAYARTISGLVTVVRDWLDGADPRLPEFARNAAHLARPNASLDIASDICRHL
jgi:hypothetical protein